MTPQERTVIDGIFERLRTVAGNQRDPETDRYIADLIRQQPYAPYALAQSVYVQEQAILNQQQQIEELQAENARLQSQPQKSGGGFLSGLFGGGQPAQPQAPAYGQRAPQPGYAPQPQPSAYAPQPQQAPPSPWGQPQQQPPQRQGMGFLGTAATAAVGVAGGMLVANALSSAFSGGAAKAATPAAAPTPASDEQGGGMDNERHNASYDDGGYDDGGFDSGGDSYDA